MTKAEHLLTILIEECGETSHRATKALRFGLEEIQPGQELTNAQRVIYEFNDIVSIMQMLRDEKLISDYANPEMIKLKKEKVLKYLNYSIECGTIDQQLSSLQSLYNAKVIECEDQRKQAVKWWGKYMDLLNCKK